MLKGCVLVLLRHNYKAADLLRFLTLFKHGDMAAASLTFLGVSKGKSPCPMTY
jgi:hypothetical protein